MYINDENRMVDIRDLLEGKYQITPPDMECLNDIKKRWDSVAKPLDGMGKFETVTSKMGAILGDTSMDFKKKAILVFCADNGVVEEGVSQSGQNVTLAVAKAMGKRQSSVCKMAEKIGADVIPIDVGINTNLEIEGVINKRIRQGTRNFSKEPAMTEDEVLKAIRIGMDMVLECKQSGYKMIGVGEMGIGNTTTSCAVATALLGCRAETIVGRGAGLSDEGLRKKEKVIQEAVERYNLYQAKPMEVLRNVGGFDIAALTGAVIGGAVYHVPIILDGVITVVAALVACRMFEPVREFIFASHIGKEPAIAGIVEKLGLEPVICADLALGEGTGAVLFCGMIDIAMEVYSLYTFNDLKIEPYVRNESDGV